MRYALISDIHANVPALEAVLNQIGVKPEIDATYHLGDLVGYAPWPDETGSLLKGFRIEGVAGNYDSTTASDYMHCGCKYEDPRQEELSHLSYEWTRQHCSAGRRGADVDFYDRSRDQRPAVATGGGLTSEGFQWMRCLLRSDELGLLHPLYGMFRRRSQRLIMVITLPAAGDAYA